jgi:hypothetical protein
MKLKPNAHVALSCQNHGRWYQTMCLSDGNLQERSLSLFSGDGFAALQIDAIDLIRLR